MQSDEEECEVAPEKTSKCNKCEWDTERQPSAARGCAECLNLTMGTAQQDALVWCWLGPFHSHMITVSFPQERGTNKPIVKRANGRGVCSSNGTCSAALHQRRHLPTTGRALTGDVYHLPRLCPAETPLHSALGPRPSALSRRETLPAPAAVREANRLIDIGKTVGDTRDAGGRIKT
ncbi:unnamed protein product [Arctogadus glacialis]